MLGTVILDLNTIRTLEPDHVRERVLRSLEMVGLRVQITAINVLEAVQTTDPVIRSRLLRVLAACAGDRVIAQLPHHLLRRVGAMLLRGDSFLTAEPSRLEWLLHEPERIEAKHIEFARQLLTDQRQRFLSVHRAARREVRARLKGWGGDQWGDIVAFLEDFWTRIDPAGTFMARW